MTQNFLGCDRDQELLLPPSLREWLPEGHLAWFVIDAVAALDLRPFYVVYRDNGQGRAAHDPAMMVAVLLYSYAVGERSSRRIERRCIEDVATRVICANQRPGHTTVARFRRRHETALAGLFGEVLALCAEAGLVRVGVIAVDGTKVHANASERATRNYEQIAREILDDAAARFLAAEVLARRGALPGGLPADALARAYVDGLRAGASADMANPWGIPSGPLGPAGVRVASLGAAAVAPLEGALDDEGGLRFVGSREASIGNSYGWRVKDVAASVLAAITGQAFDVDRDPAKRDAAIEELRRRVDGGTS
jgi:transposase